MNNVRPSLPPNASPEILVGIPRSGFGLATVIAASFFPPGVKTATAAPGCKRVGGVDVRAVSLSKLELETRCPA